MTKFTKSLLLSAAVFCLAGPALAESATSNSNSTTSGNSASGTNNSSTNADTSIGNRTNTNANTGTTTYRNDNGVGVNSGAGVGINTGNGVRSTVNRNTGIGNDAAVDNMNATSQRNTGANNSATGNADTNTGIDTTDMDNSGTMDNRIDSDTNATSTRSLNEQRSDLNNTAPGAGDAGMNARTSTGISSNVQDGMRANAGADISSYSRAQIRQVQNSLRQSGHAISADGRWGPRTSAAIRRFQQENNLDVTGTLDAQTLAALNSTGAANSTATGGQYRANTAQ